MSEQNQPKEPRREVRINQPLDAELHKRLKVRAAEEGMSLQALVSRLLEWAADKKLDTRATA